jgi:hypothetical protein
MSDAKRSIFRVEAVRRYAQHRETAVLPRFVSPRTFRCLWVLTGLLAVGGGLASFAQVPVYASGSAIVVDARNNKLQGMPDDVVVALLPPEHHSHFEVGQQLFLHFPPTAERLRRSIIAVELEIYSPVAAQRRFGLAPGAALAVAHPAAVALAQLEPLPAGAPASAYLGSIGRVDVEVGSRRIISLLPFVDQHV